ncbi:MAG TPA: hypothetical protein VG148_18915 [Pyrinomonadaceae bacterium]|nr:hypothetical protein [Pyrinomonadaceae bacterium]
MTKAAQRFLTAFLMAALAAASCYGAKVRRAAAGGREAPPPSVAAKRAAFNRPAAARFGEALAGALGRRGLKPSALCAAEGPLGRRILEEYGAVFLAADEVLTPRVCVFKSAEEVASFQREARAAAGDFGGVTVELQPAAMRALLAAREEATAAGLSISPRDGAEAGRRDYAATLRLWNSRLLPALEHWRRLGHLTPADADRLAALPVREQVGAVLDYERRGIFFSRDFSKSILYSAAAPGTSQHLSLLAFDVVEHDDPDVRRILARHGWFRTVRGDAPHFTYLGLVEDDLPSRGLKKVRTAAGEFWVPNV